MVSAQHSWVMAFDNLSKLSAKASDALCRLSTGGGSAKRRLFTDDDEVVFDSQRPILLTSIDDVATRSDLLDRCIVIELGPIYDDKRRSESEMNEEFEAVRPLIFGALLDAVSGALRNLPSTRLDSMPRMADFACWVTAAEESLGWKPGTFLTAYESNRASANELAIDSSSIGRPLVEYLMVHKRWEGSASELLAELNQIVSDEIKGQSDWPKNGRSLASQLKRLAPNLLGLGWRVDHSRIASKRSWVIEPLNQTVTPAPPASPLPPPAPPEAPLGPPPPPPLPS